MDFSLMQQISHGSTKFTSLPKLTAFPIGANLTPGLIANSLYQIYTPLHSEKSPNVESKQVKRVELEKIEEQKGAGHNEEPIKSSEPLKRKLEDDVFQKMLHPTFKVSKLQPKVKKEKNATAQKSGGSSSMTLKETQKKYHKF